jgi:hypothetical protein
VRTLGLTDAQIESASARHAELGEAIDAAHAASVIRRRPCSPRSRSRRRWRT